MLKVSEAKSSYPIARGGKFQYAQKPKLKTNSFRYERYIPKQPEGTGFKVTSAARGEVISKPASLNTRGIGYGLGVGE